MSTPTILPLGAFIPDPAKNYAIGPGTQKQLVAEWRESIEYGTWMFRLVGESSWGRIDLCPSSFSVCEVDALGRELLVAVGRRGTEV